MVSETPYRAIKHHFDGTGTEIQMCCATKALPVGTGMGKSTSRATKHPLGGTECRRCEKMLGTCTAIK